MVKTKGTKAIANVSVNHTFTQDEAIEYVEMDSDLNVNDKKLYYLFSSQNGLIQTLQKHEFEWLVD